MSSIIVCLSPPGDAHDGTEQHCSLARLVHHRLLTDVSDVTHHLAHVQVRSRALTQQLLDHLPHAASLRRRYHIILVSELLVHVHYK